MLARPVELFNMLKILRPEVFSSFWDFAYRYCKPTQGPYGMEFTGSSNPRELHLLLKNHLMIRR